MHSKICDAAYLQVKHLKKTNRLKGQQYVIKQNQSEVGQIQFPFFLLTVCTIFTATFCKNSHYKWSIGSKDMNS